MTPEDRQFLHQTSVRITSVNRAAVLYACLLAGLWGGHKFLLGARREGWMYLLLSWTSIPLWASLGDFVDLVRQPAIGQGLMQRRLLKRHPADRDVVERATWLQLGRVVVIFALLVGAMVWMMARIGEGGERVNALCDEIKPGMPQAELALLASRNQLRHGPLREGHNSLVDWDGATMGRHNCTVLLEGGVVRQSSHSFLD